MPINPYLFFAGNCREAVAYYADVFGIPNPPVQTFGEMPPNPDFPLSEEAKNLVLHAMLTIGGTPVMFSDVFPGSHVDEGNNVSLVLTSKDPLEIRNGFNRLKEDGEVRMDLQETFWTKLYGTLRDKFGIEWQFSLDSGEPMQ